MDINCFQCGWQFLEKRSVLPCGRVIISYEQQCNCGKKEIIQNELKKKDKDVLFLTNMLQDRLNHINSMILEYVDYLEQPVTGLRNMRDYLEKLLSKVNKLKSIDE